MRDAATHGHPAPDVHPSPASGPTHTSLPGDGSPPAWRAFLRLFAASALGFGLFVWLFVVLVDPWGSLPLHLPVARVPISTNARYSFPALARSDAFDSAVFGTSTSRLLRPQALDALLGGRFVNLAMNSATAWEQGELLAVFARSHPHARTVLVGLDDSWCRLGVSRLREARPFPDWMYAASRWRGYGAMFDLYAVQEAANQFAVLLGLKRRRYGLDGYTDFLPPEGRYDPARVDAIFRAWGEPPTTPPAGPLQQPELDALAPTLRLLPAGTRVLLFFTPDSLGQQGVPGSQQAAKWRRCKDEVVRRVAPLPGVTVIDFLLPSPITRERDHYWDPIHYRVPVADQLMRDLARAAGGEAAADDSYRLLRAPQG